MQVLRKDDVGIYNLTKGKQLPEWIPERKRRKMLQEDPELQRRIELIQDFTMPTASNCVTMPTGGNYIYTAGTYKPRIRCYEVDQLSMKFERQLQAEVVAMQCLSEDYSKLAMLLADRSVEVHARYGYHYKTRIPKCGRDLVYHYPSCDLFVVGSSSEIYRLNLDQGRFLSPLQSSTATAINTATVNPLHGLLCVGTDTVARSIPSGLLEGIVPQVTAVTCYGSGGLNLGVGTSSGHVLLYDLRSSAPLLLKDHNNDMPIKKVIAHELSGNIFSADTKGIKIWDQNTGKNYTSLETAADINDVCVVPDTGLFFVANESSDLFTYFIPSLAPAPKWCAYLDSITEELEEEAQPAVYDDYKFVTRAELQALGVDHLIGSNMLRAYMHGFFMDAKLYREAKAIANPFEYDEYRKEQIEKLLDDGNAKRIKLRKAAKALPKVNRALAARLLDEADGAGQAADGKKKKKKSKAAVPAVDAAEATATNPLGDDRFKGIFADEDFEIDEESEQYRLLHPSESMKSKPDLLVSNGKFTEVAESDDDEGGHSAEESEVEGKGSDEDSSDEEVTFRDPAASTDVAKPKEQKKKTGKKKSGKNSGKGPQPHFLELAEGETYKPGMASDDLQQSKQSKKERKRSFADRIRKGESAGQGPRHVASLSDGAKEMSFRRRRDAPPKTAETTAASVEDAAAAEKRRGVRTLGLKRAPKQKYWRGKPV